MPIDSQITQKNLDDFKSLYPDDPRIQSLTLSEVLENGGARFIGWSSVKLDGPPLELAVSGAAIPLTACQQRLGWVVFDAVSLAVGAVALRASVNPGTVRAVAAAAAPVLSKIELIIATITKQGASTTDVAKGVFDILRVIYSGGCLGAVLKAFMGSLTWWQGILYGINASAIILAALATSGVAFVAEIIILLVGFGWLVSDSVMAYQTCSGKSAPPRVPSSGQFPNGRAVNSADMTQDAPAACVFDGKQYLFWKANDGSSKIYYSASADGQSWPKGQTINSADMTQSVLAACVFSGKLYLFWKANDGSSKIYYSASADGQSWTGGQPINSANVTTDAPAACVLGGLLYVFWKANDRSNLIYYGASPDGRSWPKGQPISTDATPNALAACVSPPNIHLFWRANDSTNPVWYGTLANGTKWLGSQPINTFDLTQDAPGACVFHETVYVFWKGKDRSNHIFWSDSVLPGSDRLPFEPVSAVATATGNYLTVVSNGGLGGGNVAIRTDSRSIGPYEKFTVQLDPENRTFALITHNGYCVTAVNGGGVEGPAGTPIQTDGTVINEWEKLIFQQQVDGTFAVCTTDGYYLTAVNGGGVKAPNGAPIQTDATAIGPWETFTLNSPE